VFYVSMWFHYSFYFLSDLQNKKKAAYRVPISRFFVHFLTMIATSFHGIAKSFCATTKYFSSSSSFLLLIKIKNLLLRSRPLYF